MTCLPGIKTSSQSVNRSSGELEPARVGFGTQSWPGPVKHDSAPIVLGIRANGKFIWLP